LQLWEIFLGRRSDESARLSLSLSLSLSLPLSPPCFTIRAVILKRRQSTLPSGMREVNFKTTSTADGGSAKKKKKRNIIH